ncbi:MAG: transposase [Bacteroidetes bacterium]|nr:transposase [Bacteroidota bacterium]
MSHSLSKLYVHLIFHIKKNRFTPIRDQDKVALYAFMGAIIKDNDSIPVLINGTNNHVHILFIMSKNVSLAGITEEIKRHSSRWIKTLDSYYSNFFWQTGYAGFSVSQSVVERTRRYIASQVEHHRKKDMRVELEEFLKEYGIEYDDTYLLTD